MATPYTADSPIQPLGLVGPGAVPVPNIETRTEGQYFQDVTTPEPLKPISPDAATPAPADPWASFADAPAQSFDQFQDAPDNFAHFKTADDLDVKSTDELHADRKGFDPVTYFSSNPDAAKDPAKLKKLLDVYRKRREEGLTAGGVAAAAIKGTPGLVGNFFGGVKRMGERAIDIGIQPTANIVLGTLTGDLFNKQKREALFDETRRVMKKGGAEISAAAESSNVGLVDISRQGLRKIEAEQHKPTYPGLFPPTPPKPGEFAGLYPEKPIKPLTDQQLLSDISDDAAFRANAADILKGQGEAAKNFGLDKETLAKQGIELDEKAIEQLSLVDPISMVAAGGAFKLVGAAGKVLGTARTLEGAQALAGKLADAAKWATGKGIEKLGTGTKLVGKGLQGTGGSAALIAGVGSAVRGAGTVEALAISAAAKAIGPVVRKTGALAEHFGKAIAGEVPISATAQKLIDYAAPVAKAGTEVAKGAVQGIVAGAPFAIAADTDEQAGALLGAGAALGAGHAAASGSFRVVKNAAAREYFGQNRPVLPDVPSPGYGKDAALDAQHEANIQKLSAQDASELNNFRQALRSQGGEIYAVDGPTWNQKIAEANPTATPEQLATYAGHSAFFDVAQGPDRHVVYLNTDTAGSKGLQHDAGHIFDAVLSPEKRTELRTAITEAFPEQKIAEFKKLYEDRVGSKITDDAAKDEFIAEQFAALFNNVPVTELNAPKSLLKKFVDVAAEAAETLGIDIGKGVTTPNLGAPVSVGIRKLFQNAAGEVTRRSVEGGAGPEPTNIAPLPPTPPPAPPGTAPVVPPTSPIPVDFRGPSAPSAPSAPAPAGRNTRVTPEQVSSFKQPPQTPEARAAAAADYADKGIEYARTEAKKADGSPTSKIIEKISDSMERGNPVISIEHRGIVSEGTPSAPLGDIKRTAEQDKGYKQLTKAQNEVRQNAPSEIVALHSKNFVPVRWEEKGGRPTLLAMSLDKVIANILKVAADPRAKELIPYPVENGKLTTDGWNQVVADLQAYSENQSNGRRGDGGQLIVPEIGLSIPAENPTYTPKRLSPERADFQNLVQGLETPKTNRLTKEKTPGNIKGQILAEANQRPVELPANIPAKRAGKQAYVEFPPRVIQEVNPLRNALERRGFNHRDLLKVTENISAKDIVSATPRPDINYKAPVTDIIRGGFLPKKLERNSNFPPPSEETFYWVSPHGELFEAGKHIDDLLNFAYDYVTRGYVQDEPYTPMNSMGWESFSIDPAIERFKIDSYHDLEPNQMAALKKWSDNLGFRMQDEEGTLHDFTKEIAQDRKEKAVASALEPGHFLPAPTEFRSKNLQGKTVEEFSDYILKSSPEEWKAATDNMTGGLTGGAWNFGLGLKDQNHVTLLKSFQDNISNAARTAMKAGDFDGAYSLVSKGQFFREAYEAATGTGSAGAAFKRGTAGMESAKPPFPAEVPTTGTTSAAGPGTTTEAAKFLPFDEKIDKLVRNIDDFVDEKTDSSSRSVRLATRAAIASITATLGNLFEAGGHLRQLSRETVDKISGVFDVIKSGLNIYKSPYEIAASKGELVTNPKTGVKETIDEQITRIYNQLTTELDEMGRLAPSKEGASFKERQAAALSKLNYDVSPEAARIEFLSAFAKENAPKSTQNPEATKFLPAEQLGVADQPPELRIVPRGAAAGGTPPVEPPTGTVIPPPVAAGRFQPKQEKTTAEEANFFSSEPPKTFSAEEASILIAKDRGYLSPMSITKGRSLEGSGWLFRDGKAIEVDSGEYHDDTVEGLNAAGSVDARNPEQFQAETGAIRLGTVSSGREIHDNGNSYLGVSLSRKPSGPQRTEIIELLKNTSLDGGNPYFDRVAIDITKGDGTVYRGKVFQYPAQQGALARFLTDPFSKEFEGGKFQPAEQLNPDQTPDLRVVPAAAGGTPPVEPPGPGLIPPPVASGAFQPRTESGRKLEERGYEIVETGEMGTRRVTILDKDKTAIAQIQSVQLSPKKAEIAFVSKKKGAPAGLGEVLYREVGSRLRDDGVTSLEGHVIRPEPLAIRKKIFGGFKKLTVNDEPATYKEAIATAERLNYTNTGTHEAAAIEPVNEITAATKFLPVGEYWMDSDGAFIHAPRGHEKGARVILADVPNVNQEKIYDEMFKRGYTRVISGDKEFHVDSSKRALSDLNSKQRGAIEDEVLKRKQELIFNGKQVGGGAFLPKVKRDAQGRPLDKDGNINYARWQAESIAARKEKEAADVLPKKLAPEDSAKWPRMSDLPPVQLSQKKALPHSEKGVLKLVHYSGTGGLKSIDPENLGKGFATPTDLRGTRKSFFFVDGSGFGSDVMFPAGQKYGVRVDGGGIYDYTTDPLNFRKIINREEQDTAIKKAGYSGFRVQTADGRDVVALYKKVAPIDLTPQPK